MTSTVAGHVLCHFSKSEILRDSILTECPLRLNAKASSACPCKTRIYNVKPYDLRVIACLHPKDWKGVAVDDERVRARLMKPGDKKLKAITPKKSEGKRKMSATASAEKTASTPEKRKPLWGEVNGTEVRIPIIGVAGEKGSGKSLFVSTIDPVGTCMMDLEESTVSYNLPFKKRWNLYEEMLQKFGRAPKPIEVYTEFRKFIESVKAGEFTVLAVDPITDLEQGMVDWVKANPGEFGRTANQYEKASGIMWADVKSHWKMMLGIMSAKFQTFAFTAHMGSVWSGSSPVPGKRAPKGKDTLFELASLYMILDRKPDANGNVPDAPGASTTLPHGKSRLAHTFVEDDGSVVIKPILPPHIKGCTPAKIRQYIKTPPDYAHLKKDEKAVIEVLTDDDRQQTALMMQLSKENEAALLAESSKSRADAIRAAAEAQAAQMGAKSAAAAAAVEQVKPVTVDNSPPFDTSTPATKPADELSEIAINCDSMRRKLGASDEAWFAAIQKRGVETFNQLTLEQAKELQRGLAAKLDAMEMQRSIHQGN